MRVGWVGLGKLGRPIAEAVAAAGHQVVGHDIGDVATTVEQAPIDQIVAGSDLVFVAVQTPHDPEFEGASRLPDERRDFDYSSLRAAVYNIAEAARRQRRMTVIVVVSTVLPGTMDREILPLLGDRCGLVYNPFFIAMGSEITDFLQPEFVLLGDAIPDHRPALRDLAHHRVETFYRTLHDRPMFWTDVRTAELTKVAYNTFIGLKIAFANTMMEICEKTGADVDSLSAALALATDRIVSPRYMRGGMGDGGGCHPRDNIALSWLARQLGLSHDLFDDVMRAREDQTGWLADLAAETAASAGLPLVIAGKAYKAGTGLTVGSPARLLAAILDEHGVEFSHFDPYTD